MITLALALLLSQVTPSLSSRVQHDATGEGFLVGWGYAQVPAASADAGVALTNMVDALQAGDKAGAWWGMYGDGTMAAGSAVTLTPTGTPVNSVEGGWPVRTYTAAQNDQEPANVAFPASDFSVCTHHRSAALGTAQIMVFGSSGASAAFVAMPLLQDASGNISSYVSNGSTNNGSTISAAPLPLVAGTWHLLCWTYQRVGGAANNVGTIYVNGIQAGQFTSDPLAHALASVWSTNGYAGAAVGQAGSVRGVFVTYKLLSASDIARIYASMAP